LKLPGFRPGKVPAEVVKKRFRDQLMGDVAEAIVNRVVFEELEGRGLRPLAMPQVADLKIDEGQPMTFRAVFETLPIVELPEYRGLEVKTRAAVVKDEDLGDFENLGELRESVKKRLLAADERKVEREVKGALVEALVDKAGFEVPESLVERHMTARTESTARGLAYQGIDPRKVGVNWREY